MSDIIKIQLGVWTKISSSQTGEQTFQLVGPDEADFKQSKLSITTPLARALLGHEAGDSVNVQMTSGRHTYQILGVYRSQP